VLFKLQFSDGLLEVPDSLLSSTRELKKFFDSSYKYVGSLKPKPATRRKKD
jgi:hypothetical protein